MTEGNGQQPDAVFAAAASLKIVRGHVDDEELAALVAGVVAMATAAQAHDDTPGAPTSAWMDRTRTMRGRRLMMPLSRGGTAWRHSMR